MTNDPLERIFRRRTDESDLVFLIDATRKRLVRRRRAHALKTFLCDAATLSIVLLLAALCTAAIWALAAP